MLCAARVKIGDLLARLSSTDVLAGSSFHQKLIEVVIGRHIDDHGAFETPIKLGAVLVPCFRFHGARTNALVMPPA